MISILDQPTLNLLTTPGPRLPLLENWLMAEVWTAERLRSSGGSPAGYLTSGEQEVNRLETLLTAAAPSYFSELLAPAERTIAAFLRDNPDSFVVILDGCSLRELPKLAELARISHRSVILSATGRSAIPSSTVHFVAHGLGMGLPSLGPSQVGSRRELKERGIRFHHFQQPNEVQQIADTPGNVLVWHRFPDLRFMDSTAASAEMYDAVWETLDLVWKRTVQAIPPNRKILVTSDHGYIFLGAGLSDRSLDDCDRSLKGKRYREFPPEETLPESQHGLWIDQQRRLAMVTGRCHNRPLAPSPSQSIYRHGGLGLMEVLTPWLVLGPME